MLLLALIAKFKIIFAAEKILCHPAANFTFFVMGVKLVLYFLFVIRKGIRNEKYVSFFIPYLIRNKE